MLQPFVTYTLSAVLTSGKEDSFDFPLEHGRLSQDTVDSFYHMHSSVCSYTLHTCALCVHMLLDILVFCSGTAH